MIDVLSAVLVEDDPDDAMLLTRQLVGEWPGARITVVDNASDLRAALLEPVDCVISDYDALPGFSAIDALRIVQELGSDIAFILMCSKMDEENAADAIFAGARDFVTKGNALRLLRSVRREVGESRRRREAAAATEALRREQEQHRLTFEQAAVGFIHGTFDGRILRCNEKFATMMGYAVDELVGRSFSELSADPEEFITADVMWGNLEGGRSHSFEKWYRRRDGSTFCALVTISASSAQMTDSDYAIGVIQDISQQKLAEEALREREERFRATFEQAAVGILHLGLDGTVLRANHKGRRMLHSERDIAGASFASLLVQEDVERAQAQFDRLISGESEAVQFQTTARRFDGSTFIVFINASIARPAAGEPYVVIVGQDVTDRVHAERQRAESEARFRDLMEQAGDAIFISDDLRLHSDANARACEITGLSKEALLKIGPPDLIEEQSGSGAAIISLSPGDMNTSECRLKRADGSFLPVEMTVKRLADGRYLNSVRDITARKQAEKRQREDEERFRLVADATKAAIFDLDFAAGSFWTNKKFEELLGTAPTNLGGTWWYSKHFHPDDREPILADIAAVAASKASHAEREYRWVRDDGDVIPVEERVLLLRDAEGTLNRVVAVISDKTKEKEAEQKLKESEERFRLVAVATDDGLLDWDLAKRTAWSNVRCREMLGLPEQITRVKELKSWWTEHLHPADREAVIDGLEAWIAGGPELSANEYRMVRDDGVVVPVLIRRYAVRDDEGRVVRIVSSIGDLTDRNKAAEALRQSEAKFRRIFEATTVGISLWKWDGSVIDANDTYLEMTGYSRSDMEQGGVNWRELTAHECAEDLKEHIDELKLRGKTRSFERKYIRKDGTHIPILVSPLASSGTFYDGMSVVVDISDRNEALVALQRSESRFRALVEQGYDLISVLSSSGELQYETPSVELITGWTPGELLGRSVFELIHPDDVERVASALGEIASVPGAACRIEYRFIHRDGSTRQFESVVRNLIETPGVDGIVANTRDVTENRAVQQKLEQTERLASLGRLGATIAHEFNNVLMGIQPFAEVIRRKADADDRLLKAASHIENSVQRGRRVTQEILRFTQPQQPSIVPFDCHHWLRELMPELRGMLGTRHSVELLANGHPVFTAGDRPQLTQVITNLVLNARDAMADGGAIRIEIDPSPSASTLLARGVQCDEPWIRIAIHDSGCGMDHKTVQQIFEPLFTTKRQGTGLGLAVAHQVITGHGGHVFVDSTQGTGTTFHLVLRRAVAAELPIHEQAATARAGAEPCRILFVEDEVAVAEGIMALLDLDGLEVRHATNGADAVALLDSYAPDVLVLDIGLPDIDGVELYDRISAKRPGTPVVFSSGHGDESKLDLAKKPHVRFVQKPYESTKLVAMIEELSQLTRA